MILARALAMPKPDLDRIAPPEPTEESRQLNLDIANRERAAIGLPPQQRLWLDRDIADLRILAQCSVIPPSTMEAELRAKLMDALDQLVEDFGLMPVCRSVQMPQGLPMLDALVGALLNSYGYAEVWRAMRLELAANGIES
jgi:hypothetical protein